MQHTGSILILDFGSQYTQLIARRIRELEVYSELLPFNLSAKLIKERNPSGIILSGGPAGVYDVDAPHPDPGIYQLGIPVLGICYGLQLLATQFGGTVVPSGDREFGSAGLTIDETADIFHGLSPGTETTVWMSHGDKVSALPPGFDPIAHSSNSPVCAIRDTRRRLYGIQFHPEVAHTLLGTRILSNFVFNICGAARNWNPGSFVGTAKREIRELAGDKGVICALSGGVDSSVLAVLLHEAIGDRLHCIHIDNGLMRAGESDQVVRLYRDTYGFNLDFIDASALFLTNLKGITDPEQKRKIIGRTFIEVFEREAAKHQDAEFLAQGTLYPDVIESVSFKGPSHTIKSHHNVGGLPERMNLRLLEPFRELFKDEVRAVGRILNLPGEFIMRHPFPGPGLAVRVLGEVTAERADLVRRADRIFLDEIRRAGLYDSVWQAFAVLLPVNSVGVMGDQRTYENVAALRAVTSTDGMTADWAPLPLELLAKVSSRIVNEVRGINRVVYDISSKPPSTIEWE